jgi:hypothetical protein
MKKQLFLMMLLFLGLGAYAQHDHNAHVSHSQEKGEPAFKNDKVGTAYLHYIHLKDALVASNAGEAKKAAGELEKSLASVPDNKQAVEAAKVISSSADLKDQRKTFSSLSNAMAKLVKESKLASGSLYVEYCPMANNNEGAFWLSNEKEIKNPYFGDMMLKCGSVKETIQ